MKGSGRHRCPPLDSRADTTPHHPPMFHRARERDCAKTHCPTFKMMLHRLFWFWKKSPRTSYDFSALATKVPICCNFHKKCPYIAISVAKLVFYRFDTDSKFNISIYIYCEWNRHGKRIGVSAGEKKRRKVARMSCSASEGPLGPLNVLYSESTQFTVWWHTPRL